MPHQFTMLMVLALTIACNNGEKDSVEKADSANKVNRENDTVPEKKVAITTGKAGAEFLVRATDAGLMEIALGTIAMKKAANKRVRDFGEMTLKEHTNIDEIIKSLADARTVTIPTMTSDENAKIIGRINEKKDTAFDKAYINRVVEEHKKAVREFETASNNVDDSEIRSFITATLPILRRHLDSCKAIQEWFHENEK
jgi:putative membrane protein